VSGAALFGVLGPVNQFADAELSVAGEVDIFRGGLRGFAKSAEKCGAAAQLLGELAPASPCQATITGQKFRVLELCCPVSS
jgi:hypothetical protein